VESGPGADPEVLDLVEALWSYGVLTHAELRDRSGASHWSEHSFEAALKRGVETGSIKSLGDNLFEAGGNPPDPSEGPYDPS
jgi:hypothetical protein